MLKLLVCLVLLASTTAASHAIPSMPDNPIAIGNCTAKVKVDAARLRSSPSLGGRILGVRTLDDSVYVTKVLGKWAQVVVANGDTAFMAAYLLAFPADQVLEQWKRDSPSPSVGKKARVKWAETPFRKYPSAESPLLGRFDREDRVGVLTDLGNGWSLVESRESEGEGACYGFVANAALERRDADPREWNAPLARIRLDPGQPMEPEPVVESPAQYCQRTAWSPELFRLQLKAQTAEPEPLLAFR